MLMPKEITMKSAYFLLVSGLLGLVAAATASTSAVKLIANESVTTSTVSVDEVKQVFLMTSPSFGSGGRVVPVLEKGGAAHEAFLKEYVRKSDDALLTYYRSLLFTGKATMPKICGTDAEVVEYVAKTKGAVGYVSAETPSPGTKTLTVK
jgi:hypothetical protein